MTHIQISANLLTTHRPLNTKLNNYSRLSLTQKWIRSYPKPPMGIEPVLQRPQAPDFNLRRLPLIHEHDIDIMILLIKIIGFCKHKVWFDPFTTFAIHGEYWFRYVHPIYLKHISYVSPKCSDLRESFEASPSRYRVSISNKKAHLRLSTDTFQLSTTFLSPKYTRNTQIVDVPRSHEVPVAQWYYLHTYFMTEWVQTRFDSGGGLIKLYSSYFFALPTAI